MERTGCSPARSMSSVQARGYFSAFHLACIDVSNFAQSTVLPRSASCSAAPMSSPPPDGSRSEPSKRTADAFATCAASRLARSFGYAVAGTDLIGEMIAPVPAQTEPASAVVMYCMNSLTPGLVVKAAMTSPPMVTDLLLLMLGKSNQSRSEEHTSELQSRQYLVCR